MTATDGHGHAHSPSRAADRDGQRRVLWLVLAANATFLVVEVVGGFAFNSLALLADGAHMLSDVAGLGIALVAHYLVDRPATARHSFGLQRAEVLAAQANGLVLVLAAIVIIVGAIHRIGDPVDVSGAGLLVVATIGLGVNLWSARLIARSSGESLNMRGAYLHMALDAAGSVGAIVAGIAVVAFGADTVDSVVSIGIALLVLWSAWALLRDAGHVLLEGTPKGLDPASIQAALENEVDVEAVHHLHLWNLASDVPALSAHVVLRGEMTLHDAQASGDRLKVMLDHRFGIQHSTLELECHPCAPAPDEHQPRVR
jgi:cobalt-zinc-cadmium efflux system protein